MTFMLIYDCEIAHHGNKKACLEFSKKHPKINFKLYVVCGVYDVKGGEMKK